MTDVSSQIASLVADHPVLLFMKGTREAPQCGFSSTVVRILDRLVPSYATFDVLSDQSVREGIKEFSDWPTIPQLYVDGEFVGGCDIIQETYASGELHETLGLPTDPPKAPSIQVSDSAKQALEQAAQRSPGNDLHLSIDARFQYSLGFGPKQGDEIEAQAGGFTFLLDRDSARRADGMSIDVRDGKLSVDNPNEPKVHALSVAELDAWRKSGETFELLDVRTEEERNRASIDGSTLVDPDQVARLEALDRGTRLVFFCHHGGRSQAAAQHFASLGFTDVWNLEGGIDAWSTEIDPSVPRY